MRSPVLHDETLAGSFTGFVAANERRLRLALSAGFGSEVGREAAAEALAYGWENWERIGAMGRARSVLVPEMSRRATSRSLRAAPKHRAGWSPSFLRRRR